ncbi:hypothetical protein HanIR_Chr03g0111671 [Helianthus annuus]|nr:hypothetical protein HanIR_Chr03g0111671 [Helianthus annuus]
MCVRITSKYIIKSHLKYIVILSPKYKYSSQKYYILFHLSKILYFQNINIFSQKYYILLHIILPKIILLTKYAFKCIF